jgi:hypothetical protein
MSDQLLRLLIGGVILVHGIAHGGAIGALLWVRSGHATAPGSWTAARSWLAPGLSAESATAVAIGLYAIALVGFVLTALAFFGIVLPVDWWRLLGVGSAIASTAGIAVFFGTWPAFNMLAALAVNVGVVVAVVLD